MAVRPKHSDEVGRLVIGPSRLDFVAVKKAGPCPKIEGHVLTTTSHWQEGLSEGIVTKTTLGPATIQHLVSCQNVIG